MRLRIRRPVYSGLPVGGAGGWRRYWVSRWLLNGRFLHDKAPAKLFANEAAAAITRAAEGKNPPKEIDPNKWAFDRGLESY
jgi:hypothetical protein